MAAPMPAQYNAVQLKQSFEGTGADMLKTAQTSAMVRPEIGVKGGKRSYRRRIVNRRSKVTRKRGGFLPSVGEGFAALAAKYVTPVALYSLFRFMRGSKKTRRSTRKSRRKL